MKSASLSYPPYPSDSFAIYQKNLQKGCVQTQSTELLSQAVDYFKKLRDQEPVLCELAAGSPEQILYEIYQKHDFMGLCIGEYHNEKGSKAFLIDHMNQLKQFGVKTLYLEHLEHDTMQTDLDDWFSGKTADLSEKTILFLENLDRKLGFLNSPYSYANLIFEAKKAGIRVVGIDSSISAVATGHLLRKDRRIKAMNYTAKKIMDLEGEGKYIVLTGIDHGSTQRNLKDIPGISELMQCPFLVVRDPLEKEDPSIILNPQSLYKLGYINEQNSVHAIVNYTSYQK